MSATEMAARRGATPVEEALADALTVEDLHVTFMSAGGDVHALRGATLTVRPGEIMGLVGESGSGKSVLGLAALGLLPRDPAPHLTGRVALDGEDMLCAPEERRRALRGSYITAVYQDPMGSLNPSMRIGAQVAEAAPAAEPNEIVELLAHTGIPEPEVKVRCYPHELSGGLRQRVMIAMALARNPRLVVADEPTTALDVTMQARVLDLLARRVSEHGAALLFITHDLGVAARLCDRIAVAYAGRIVEIGGADQVLGRPRHPYSVGLLASRPTLNGAVAGGELPTLPGQPPDPRRPAAGCAFAPRCPIADEECARPVPVSIIEDRRCECHHPAGCRAWPQGPLHDGSAVLLEGAGPHDVASGGQAELVAPALVLEDVVCEFGRPRGSLRGRRGAPLRAVGGVSLTLPAAGSLAIVGESGSGKTTLLRMVVGLLQPTAGRVRLAAGPRPQLVFQDAGASLTPWLSVGDQVAERLAKSGLTRAQRVARVQATLAAVGLPREAARALPRSLSGGMRQRAAIARAIVVPPSLLACDEPVSALDVSLASQVLNLLCQLRAKLGIALLFVTHDLAAARAVADEVAVMKDGVIVEHGRAERLFAAPEHPYTRELLAAVPDVAQAA
jgi:peptide/nickel transport system ATP-binding protein